MAKRKRLLLCANYFLPHRDGVTNYVAGLANELKERYEVTILAFNTEGAPQRERWNGCTILRLPCRLVLGGAYTLPRRNREYRNVLRSLETERFDVVVTNTRFFPMTWLGGRLARRTTARWVHVEHGNNFVKHQNPFVSLVAWLVDQTRGRQVFRNADLTVGIAFQNAEFSRRLGAKRAIYIPNAIDPAQYKRVKTDIRERLAIRPNEKIVLFVGRLIRMKGVHDLITAMKEIDARLVIVGDGPERTRLEQQAKAAGINAHFLGEKDKAGVIAALSVADLFVNPSYSEGLPTSVLEAAAIGLPIVATDVGGTRSILPEETLLTPGDVQGLRHAIITGLQKKNVRYDLAEFTWKRNGERFTALLEEERTPSIRFVLPLRKGGARSAAERIATALRERAWDVRITSSLPGYAATLVAPRAEIVHTLLPLPWRLWRKHYLLHLHGDYRRERSWRTPLSWCYPAAVRNARTIVTPSASLARELAIKSTVIPNIVPETVIPRQKHDGITLLTVTGFAFKEKAEGVLEILDALRNVQTKAKLRYLIVGDGPHLAEIKEHAHTLKNIKVEFLGHRDDIPALLGTTDMFLYWSTQDTFGLAIAEAMAAGLPVIVNNYGPFTELIENNKDGVLAKSKKEYAAAVTKLLADNRLRERLGAAAKKKIVGRYGEELIIPEWETLYRELEARR